MTYHFSVEQRVLTVLRDSLMVFLLLNDSNCLQRLCFKSHLSFICMRVLVPIFSEAVASGGINAFDEDVV